MTDHKLLLSSDAEAILDSLNFSVMIIDAERIIRFANRNLTEELGRTLANMVGQTCYKICHNLDRPCRPSEVNCPVAHIQEHDEPIGIVHNHITAADENDIVYISAISFRYRGEPYHLCLSVPVNDRHSDTVIVQKKRHQVIEAILKCLPADN